MESSLEEARRFLEIAIVYLGCLYEQNPPENQTKKQFIDKHIGVFSKIIKQQCGILPEKSDFDFPECWRVYVMDYCKTNKKSSNQK